MTIRDTLAMRALLVAALRDNPILDLSRIEVRLDDPAADLAFAEIALDSLGRLETCIWMEVHGGVTLRESEMLDHPHLLALSAHLARR